MPHLIYDGILPQDVLYSVEHSRYPVAIEMKSFPPYEAFQKLFADKTWDHFSDDCMGIMQHSVRQGIPYGWIAKNFSSKEDRSGFLMVPSTEDRDRIVVAFTDLLVDSNPFKTIVHPVDRHAPEPAKRKTYREWAAEPMTRTTWAAGMAFLAVVACALVLLSGCTSGPAYPRSIADGGTMVGPYDITLTSHQEALGIRR